MDFVGIIKSGWSTYRILRRTGPGGIMAGKESPGIVNPTNFLFREGYNGMMMITDP